MTDKETLSLKAVRKLKMWISRIKNSNWEIKLNQLAQANNREFKKLLHDVVKRLPAMPDRQGFYPLLK